MLTDTQTTVEKARHTIWLKRDDGRWLKEYRTSLDNQLNWTSQLGRISVRWCEGVVYIDFVERKARKRRAFSADNTIHFLASGIRYSRRVESACASCVQNIHLDSRPEMLAGNVNCYYRTQYLTHNILSSKETRETKVGQSRIRNEDARTQSISFLQFTHFEQFNNF